MSTPVSGGAHRRPALSPVQRLWRRELDHYPDEGRRYTSSGIVVLATVILYYENYIGGAVATQILADLDMSFGYFVDILVIANGVGALRLGVGGPGRQVRPRQPRRVRAALHRPDHAVRHPQRRPRSSSSAS